MKPQTSSKSQTPWNLSLALLLALPLMGSRCDGGKPVPGDSSPDIVDVDGDGYAEGDDCDDHDASVHPDADEQCDGVDNDCDGETDEGIGDTWYLDADADGYGVADDQVTACEQPTGYTDNTDDCDDDRAETHPGADEYCNGIDDDCDGDVDEDAVDVSTTWYFDGDSDGYGDPDLSQEVCEQPTGYVLEGGDCDDADAEINPGATEYCDDIDNDCDGDTDEPDAADAGTWYIDTDGDSYGAFGSTELSACEQPSGYVADHSDCDDADAEVNPAATEYCDGIDNDCDGDTDEPDAADASTWYADTDGDTYGDILVANLACYQPSGYVADDTDCDDSTAAVNPAATEQCNGVDDDCDGDIDEPDAADASTWYADTDGDTYGDPAVTDVACSQPSGYVADDTDCDDTSFNVNPSAVELCNGVDDDCDGTTDEPDAADASTWYADTDGDTYGDAATSTVACDQPSGYVGDDTDCDDTSATVGPGSTEYCNGVDDDCDGDTDEPDAADATTWYADTDGDTYGDPAVTDVACSQPSGYVADDTDCDDSAASVSPAASEVCNSVDDDCDGTIDEGVTTTYYADADADSYGDAASTTEACSQPSGYVTDATDCDDSAATTYPGADEYCDGVDNDCDGTTDEDGGVVDGDTYYTDADGDGLGVSTGTIDACAVPSGYADNTYDCDDTDATEPKVADDDGSSSASGTWADPYSTIQAAIDAASACVLVLPGTYAEAIDFGGANLLVESTEGSASTFIDASGLSDAAVTLDSGETSAVLTGFTIQNGEGHLDYSSESYSCGCSDTCYYYYYSYCGGGLYMDATTAAVSDVIITTNELAEASTTASGDDTTYVYSYGGGVCLVNSAILDLDDATVSENYADQGGGFYVGSSAYLTADATWIRSNSASDGAGAEVDEGTATFTNAIFDQNPVSSDPATYGGSVYVTGGTLSLVNVVSYYGTATTGGGIYGESSCDITIANSIMLYDATYAVATDGTCSFAATYSDFYTGTSSRFSGVTDPTGTSGNVVIDPAFTDAAAGDFSLGASSSCVDAGDPSSSYNDTDGSQNDMGAYGGPGGGW